MKKVLLFLIILFIPLYFTGCDSEIHDRMIIRGIGIDYENEFIKLNVRVEDVLNNSEINMQTKGETVYDALTNLSLQSGSRQMYADSYFIVFGKSMAKEGIEKAADFFVRYFKALPTEQIFIAENKAEDILLAEKEGKLIPSSVIKDLKNSGKNSGKAVSVSLMELLSDAMSPSLVTVIPCIDNKEDKLILSGAYVFKNLDPRLYLNNSEIESLMIAKGDISTASVVCNNEVYGKVSLELNKSKVKVDIDKLPGKINYEIEVSSFITSVSPISPKKIVKVEEIEKDAAEKIRGKIMTLISKCYKNECDVLGIKYKIYREKIKENIKESEYDFNVIVKMNINKTGHEGDLNA